MASSIDDLDLKALVAAERRNNRPNWPLAVLALVISAVWIVPFYYMATSIFKTTEEYSQNHPLSLPASWHPVIENAVTAWTNAKMASGLLNSMLYSTVGAGLAVFIAALAAYGLTRFDFRDAICGSC